MSKINQKMAKSRIKQPYTILKPNQSFLSLSVLPELFFTLLNSREMTYYMALRDLKALNKGAFLGIAWIIINPLIQVSFYVIIVSFVFQTKLNDQSNTFDYALYVLSGMIPWQILTKSLQEAPSLIRDRMELVKQVIYPIETLPVVNLIVNSVGMIITTLIYLMLSIISNNFHLSFFLIPIPCFLLALFIIGSSWILSIAGIIIKDIREIVVVTLNFAVYLSPVILTEFIASSKLWRLVLINPLSHIIICFRDVFNAQFHLFSWLIFTVMSLFMFIVGGLIINKVKLIIREYI